VLPFGYTSYLVGILPERHLYQKDADSGAQASGNQGAYAQHLAVVRRVLIVAGESFHQQDPA
jgi:hypothetical protein